jgi:hypothetical protein
MIGRCATCAFWRRQGSPLSKIHMVIDVDPDVGTCQAMPPSVLPAYASGVFPQIHADRSCGEWTSLDGDDEDGPAGPDNRERSPTVVPFRKDAA